MKVEWKGTEDLAKKLKRVEEVRWEAVCLKNLTQIYTRGKSNGTPYKSGELRQSLRLTKPSKGFSGEVGYSVEYAPHVEYGHRAKGGRFVNGQHFLQDNVDAQRPTFRQDLIDNLRKA